MNKITRLLTLLLVIAMLVGCFASCELLGMETEEPAHEHTFVDGKCECGETEEEPAHTHSFVNGKCECGETETKPPVAEFIDYASQAKFDPNSGRAYTTATVVSYIDGDTTHFEVPTSIVARGTLKARYLGINTPESTGVIEPWGKKASNYTKTQLMKATDIIIESDSATWDLDSTGERHLVWVWYKTAEDKDFRNLNLEILQQGLAFGSNVSSNVYSEVALAALVQAKALKLHVFSTEKDPDFYYGGVTELTLKELKANCEKYEGKLVKFEAVVAKRSDVTVYVEEYDAENDMYFGMQVFCGYNYPAMGDFKVGNRVVIVGTLQYYENGGTFQVSNLQQDFFNPEQSCGVISKGHTSSYNEITVDKIMNGTIELDTYKTVTDENGEVVDEILVKEIFDYGELAHYSTATIKNLTVKSVYMTSNGGDSDGALTITCQSEEGITFQIRFAEKLTKDDGSDVVKADFPAGTVISAKGVIDSYNGTYQLKVFSYKDIVFE